MKTRLVLIFFWFVILAANVLIQMWFTLSIVFSVKRATAIAMGYDRLGNAAMGQGNETISSWAGRHGGWQERFINWLFRLLTGEENHCDKYREVWKE